MTIYNHSISICRAIIERYEFTKEVFKYYFISKNIWVFCKEY